MSKVFIVAVIMLILCLVPHGPYIIIYFDENKMPKINNPFIKIGDSIYTPTEDECINYHRQKCTKKIFIVWGTNK